jgi:hypothetical protein
VRWPKFFSRRARLPVFDRIFNDNLWFGTESRSGPGSSLVQTATIRRAMPDLLRRLEVRSILDVPCGDGNWMQHVDLGLSTYVGADIVPEIVTGNRARFGTGDRQFVLIDMTRDPIPPVDLILCRDGLVHLSFDDAVRAVANFCRSGSTYILTTTFPRHQTNAPIRTGQWRPLNLEKSPFCLPRPLEVINEDCTEGDGQFADKSLGLWRIEDLMFRHVGQ